MTAAGDLAGWAAQLGHAVAGANRIAASVVASGNVQTKTGLVLHEPGPGLSSVLARHSGTSSRRSNTANDAQLPAVADQMAASALRQGVNLLKGNR